jgi:GTP-binding protein
MQDLPQDMRLEVAMIGRSNAGKSSLINAMYGTAIAKVSNTPGKTRTINFFDVGDFYRVVDMPGYGFAARGWAERDLWKQMIEDYLALRASLIGFVLVMDIRRDWQDEEADLVRWMRPRGLPLLVALAKADKIKRGEIESRRRAISQASHLPLEQIMACSNSKKMGVREIEEAFFHNWVKPTLLNTAGTDEEPI